MLSDAVKMKLQSLFLCECDCPGRPYVRVCADCIRGIVSFAVAEAVAAERELLEYIYEQTLGDLISPGIKDDAMMRVYLSVGMLRRIAAIRARGEEQG